MDNILRRVIGGAFAVPIALFVELKAVNALNGAYHAQRIDYLEAFGPHPGLLLSFGTKRLEIKRMANTG